MRKLRSREGKSFAPGHTVQTRSVGFQYPDRPLHCISHHLVGSSWSPWLEVGEPSRWFLSQAPSEVGRNLFRLPLKGHSRTPSTVLLVFPLWSNSKLSLIRSRAGLLVPELWKLLVPSFLQPSCSSTRGLRHLPLLPAPGFRCTKVSALREVPTHLSRLCEYIRFIFP